MTKNTNTSANPPNTGTILANYIHKKRIPQAALARALNKTPNTIIAYKKAASIQTKTLWKISYILKRNFFMDIAQMLPDTFSTEIDIFETHNKRIAELEEENKILKAEKAVLLESKK